MLIRGRGYILFDIETGVYLLSVERHTAYDGNSRSVMGYSRKIESLN